MKSKTGPISPKRLKKLLLDLLDIYSPSGKEEEAVDFLYEYFLSRGLPVRRQKVDDHRDNLLVVQPGVKPEVVFTGHLDTVPAYDLDEYGPKLSGDVISALGAADMKGGCAAMAEAFVCLWSEKGSLGPVMLALVVGEEEEGDGTERLLKKYGVPWAILGEPTDLRPCLSHHGYLGINLSTIGERAHASLPGYGHNAVEDMLKLLLGFIEYFKKNKELTCNVRDFLSSGTGFAVPDSCRAWLDVHFPPTLGAAEVIEKLKGVLALQLEKNPDLKAMIDFEHVFEGFTFPENGSLINTLKQVFLNQRLDWSPGSFPSHSDANELWLRGVTPVILGPGSLEKAHRPDESILFSQVVDASVVYYQTAAAITEQKYLK